MRTPSSFWHALSFRRLAGLTGGSSWKGPVMTRTALLYQLRQKVRVAIAFAAALLIHFAAIAIANVQRVEKASGPPFQENFPEITFEVPPSEMAEPTPEHPKPLPTPPETEESFPTESPT